MVLGWGGTRTVSEIDAVAVRDCASVIVACSVLGPSLVPTATAVENVNTLSPPTASPFVPSSKKGCAAEPPIAVRSARTAMPVLGGPLPGVTVTMRRVVSPGSSVFGLAAPTPDGLVVTTPLAVSEKSSTARPSSAPEALKSVQRIQNVAPGAMLIGMLAVSEAWFVLPSSSPTVPVVIGLEKSSASTSIQVAPAELSPVALTLYWKAIRSGPRLAVPRRHCSPVYAITSSVMVPPVLFTKLAPKIGTRPPLCSPPRARSGLPVAPKL